MVEFQTIKAEEVKFGKNNFLEIARKKAITEEGDNEYIAVSRGFFLPDGTKKFKKSLAIPDDKEIIDFIVSKLKELCKSTPQSKSKKAVHAEAKEAEEPAEEPTEE